MPPSVIIAPRTWSPRGRYRDVVDVALRRDPESVKTSVTVFGGRSLQGDGVGQRRDPRVRRAGRPVGRQADDLLRHGQGRGNRLIDHVSPSYLYI